MRYEQKAELQDSNKARIYEARMYEEKKKITMQDFQNWLEECPVPYNQTCNGVNTTEYYSFNLIDVEFEGKNE